MVKIGFIVEGKCEKIVVESETFKNLLQKNGFELIEPVIDANGAGNLLPENIEPFIDVLETMEAERLYILTDSDGLPIKEVKERIRHTKIAAYFIAVKAIEAWFLADTQAMKKFYNLSILEEKIFQKKPRKCLGIESVRLLGKLDRSKDEAQIKLLLPRE